MIENLYNVTYNLYSYEQTGRTNIGGVEKTAVFKSSAPAYYTYIRGGEQYKFGKNNVIAKFRLFCAKTNIKSTDIINIQNLWFNIIGIDPCSKFEHHYEVTLSAIYPQNIQQESGWTWGEQNPIIETAEEWNWYLKETNIPATTTGIWGEMEITSMQQVVSPVKDSGYTGNKYIELSFDDYDTCLHNSGQKIWWRGSVTIFNHADDEVIGPVWTAYTVGSTVNTNLRYLQIMCGIY